jgi:hypothetical protein
MGEGVPYAISDTWVGEIRETLSFGQGKGEEAANRHTISIYYRAFSGGSPLLPPLSSKCPYHPESQ